MQLFPLAVRIFYVCRHISFVSMCILDMSCNIGAGTIDRVTSVVGCVHEPWSERISF